MTLRITFKKNVELFLSGAGGETILTLKCRCGQEHDIVLDPSGHFDGSLPCDESVPTRIQVEPELWREIVEKRQLETRH